MTRRSPPGPGWTPNQWAPEMPPAMPSGAESGSSRSLCSSLTSLPVIQEKKYGPTSASRAKKTRTPRLAIATLSRFSRIHASLPGERPTNSFGTAAVIAPGSAGSAC